MLYKKLLNKETALAVIGLGYVGIPLAVAFDKHLNVIGYDINEKKVQMYQNRIDPTGEVEDGALATCNINFTSDPSVLRKAKFFIIAVPTPVFRDNTPDLTAVRIASQTVGQQLSPGSIVVYESTVSPGVTEELCTPILEHHSGLKAGLDFKVGYSPERVNPADKVHRLHNIIKVVSGMDAETLDIIARVYDLVVTAGTYRAGSIAAAEAIKLVENTQRDVNIAFMNEVAAFFDMVGIDTQDVLNGMATKWNALNFSPGLVGGHCIGVDPYYYIHAAGRVGFFPSITISSRTRNNSMGHFIVQKALRAMIEEHIDLKDARIFVLGGTFKENCVDTRNSRVKDIIEELQHLGLNPMLNDPLADQDELRTIMNCHIVDLDDIKDADCVIIAVAHDIYQGRPLTQLRDRYRNRPGRRYPLIDVKRMFERTDAEQAGFRYWGL